MTEKKNVQEEALKHQVLRDLKKKKKLHGILKNR